MIDDGWWVVMVAVVVAGAAAAAPDTGPVRPRVALPVEVVRSGCGTERFVNLFRAPVAASCAGSDHQPDGDRLKEPRRHQGTDRRSSSARDLEQRSAEQDRARA